jgi:hypothetical protein
VKYVRKIPTTVTAIQFDGSPESYYACREFIGKPKADKTDPEGSLYVKTHIGRQEVQRTDWITKDEYSRFLVMGDGSFQHQFGRPKG